MSNLYLHKWHQHKMTKIYNTARPNPTSHGNMQNIPQPAGWLCSVKFINKITRISLKKRVWITAQARHWSDLQAMLLWSHKIINNISGNKSGECIQSVSLHTSYKIQDCLHDSEHGLPGVRPTFDRLLVITHHRKRSSSGGAQIYTNEKTLMYQSTNS